MERNQGSHGGEVAGRRAQLSKTITDVLQAVSVRVAEPGTWLARGSTRKFQLADTLIGISIAMRPSQKSALSDAATLTQITAIDEGSG